MFLLAVAFDQFKKGVERHDSDRVALASSKGEAAGGDPAH